MNEHDHIDQEDFFSDEMIEKISNLVAHIKSVINDQIDPHNFDAQGIIRSSVADFVAREHILNQKNVQEIEKTVMQQLSFEHKNANGGHVTVMENAEKITMEKMKDIVKPNVYSAVKNYIKFVRPFTKEAVGEQKFDHERFEREFNIFRERQMAYLIEDLGSEITLRELPRAFDALMALVSPEVEKSEKKFREKKEEVKRIQKKAVISRVVNVVHAYQDIDQADHDAVNAFWQKIAHDIEAKDGLTGADLAHTMHVFRTHLQKIYDVVVDMQKDRYDQNAKVVSTQQATQEDASLHMDMAPVSEIKEGVKHAPSKNIEYAQKKQEMEKRLDVAARRLTDARSLFARKTIEHNDALSRMKSFFGLAVTVNSGDVEIFQKEYNVAWMEYRTMYVQYVSAYGRPEKKNGEIRNMCVQEGIERFDADVDVHKEKVNEKISRILDNISSQYARISPKIKKAFVVSMVVGGIILGYATGKHKSEDGYNEANAHDTTQYTDVMHEEDHVDRVDALKKIVAEDAKNKESAEEKNHTSHTEVFVQEDIVNMHKMVVVEKNDSIIGSITKYLDDHTELLKNTGKTASQMAFLLTQEYGKAHKSLNLDKVYPHTQINLGITQKNVEGENIAELHIKDIVFAGGPHIVPEQQKIKKGAVQKLRGEDMHNHVSESQGGDSQGSFEHRGSSDITPQEELQKVREIIADPQESYTFKKAVFERIADIFSDEIGQEKSAQQRSQFVNRIAQMSIDDIRNMHMNERTQDRFQSAISHDWAKNSTTGRTKVANYVFRSILREKMKSTQGDMKA